MKKIGGWIFALVGLVVIASGIESINVFILKIPFLSSILPSVDKMYLMIAGIVLVIIGIVLLKGSGGRQSEEVPIYRGKNIVGYRRQR